MLVQLFTHSTGMPPSMRATSGLPGCRAPLALGLACHNESVADHLTGTQIFRERRPAAELGRYVACVFVQQVFPGSEPYTHRPVPNGSAELLCEVGAMPRVVGPQTGPVEYTLAPGATVVGVRFTPGAAPSVLGVPASEVVDLSMDADELWGRSAVALGEAVAAAASPLGAAAKLEQAIAGRLAGAAGPPPG